MPEGVAVRGLQGPQPLKASGHPPESAMFCPLPLQSYQAQFQAVARHLDVKMDITMLQKADLDAMIISMRTAHLSPNSINSYTRTLKSFFSWCNEQGITRLNIPLYKAEETVKETYSDLELSALLKKPDIRKATFAEYRDWVIINFLLNCGSRAATVRAIHTELQLKSLKRF